MKRNVKESDLKAKALTIMKNTREVTEYREHSIYMYNNSQLSYISLDSGYFWIGCTDGIVIDGELIPMGGIDGYNLNSTNMTQNNVIEHIGGGIPSPSE